MEFDAEVVTRLEDELKKQEAKLKSLVSIGRTFGHVQQGASRGLMRALRDFATELHRFPSLVEWLQNKAETDRLRSESQSEERRVARQRADSVPLVDDQDINGILAEQGIPKSNQDFEHLAMLLTDDGAVYLSHPVIGLGMIESAQRAFNKLRREIEGTQRRDEMMTVVRTAVEAAKVLPARPKVVVAGSSGKRSQRKSGRKPATADKIDKACEVWIDYHQEKRGRQGFCDWWNAGKPVVGHIGRKWLDNTLSWVRNRLIPEGRVPEKYKNKFESLKRVKPVEKKNGQEFATFTLRHFPTFRGV